MCIHVCVCVFVCVYTLVCVGVFVSVCVCVHKIVASWDVISAKQSNLSTATCTKQSVNRGLHKTFCLQWLVI